MDDLRPKGTVQVSCQQPGCNWAWWVGALDPRLPDGPWDCGNDHDASAVVDHFLGLIKVRYGFCWGSYTGAQPSTDPQRPSIGRLTAGNVKGKDRWGTEGSFRWDTLADLRDVDKAMASFKWGEEMDYPASSSLSTQSPDYEAVETVTLRPWTTYKDNQPTGTVWMVAATCDRCGGYLLFDYYGGLGAKHHHMSTVTELKPKTVDFIPEWLRGATYCEQALSKDYTNQPCAVKYGPVLKEMEETTTIRWTVFECGLLMVRDGDRYGMLYFGKDLSFFDSVDTLIKALSWGTLQELSDMLEAIPNKETFVPSSCLRTAAGRPKGGAWSCS